MYISLLELLYLIILISHLFFPLGPPLTHLVIVLLFDIYLIIYWFISFPKINWHPEIILSNFGALTAIRPQPRQVKENILNFKILNGCKILITFKMTSILVFLRE